MTTGAGLRPSARLMAGGGRRLASVLIAVALVGTASPIQARAAAATATVSVQAIPRASITSLTGVRQTKVIGYSRQHRPITAYELGNPSAPFKTVVLGSMHGFYERAGEQVVSAIRTLPIPSIIDLWVIPTINPDGDALGQRGNAAGVDLNRNWPHAWIYIAPTNDKFDTHYSGPSALSEPETQAMYKFLTAVRPNRMVSLHQPLDAVDTTDGGARDPAFRDALAGNLNLPEHALTCQSVCHGSMTGWLTAVQPGAAITVEFTQNVSSGYLTGQAARGVVAALTVGLKGAPPKVDGHLDRLGTGPGAVSIVGWTLDPQKPSSSGTVSIVVDGHAVATAAASLTRPDVNAALHVSGGHGFSTTVRVLPGRHSVCVTAQPVGTDSVATVLGGCRTVVVPQYTLTGHVDAVRPGKNSIRVVGWALDPLHSTGGAWVRIYIDGVGLAVIADVHCILPRTDVNAVMKVTGNHGFDRTFTVAPGRHTVTVTAVNTGTTSIPAQLPGGMKVAITVPNQ